MLFWNTIALSGLLASSLVHSTEQNAQQTSTTTRANQTFFVDVTAGAGVAFERAPSASHQRLVDLKNQTTVTMDELVGSPVRTHGLPGVALFDYDGDKDLDIYVSNGPGAANSLFENQLVPTGTMSFVDVALTAGVGAMDQDSTGVCSGDIDNDGDPDLVVLGHMQPNRLFENQGDGTFIDISAYSGIDDVALGASSATLGDVNGDGLLDLYVGNGTDLENYLTFVQEPHAFNHPNHLYLNLGANQFANVTATAGLTLPGDELTWAVSLVDYDQDGDLDILEANDQAVIPRAQFGGVDRAFLRIWRNDGTGNFLDATDPDIAPGAMMGMDFADFDHDGNLDVFVTNLGNWMGPAFGLPTDPALDSSRWFLGDGNGGFEDPGVGALNATPFGWGVAAEDYDNDGDTDVIYAGGIEAMMIIDSSNPGTVLRNDGQGNFEYDEAAMNGFCLRRNDQGLAMGDLNQDGAIDLVVASNMDFPASVPLVPYADDYGSEFDPAQLVPMFDMPPTGDLVWTGAEPSNGTVAVLLNEIPFEAGFVQVEAQGSAGICSDAQTPRDGVGAIVSFTPRGGNTAMKPIISGSSHASQHSLVAHFGTGRAMAGTVEIQWPGGIRNRLYNVRNGEVLTIPEIPCSFDGDWSSFEEYRACVTSALKDLRQAGVINLTEAFRLKQSAMRAYREEQRP